MTISFQFFIYQKQNKKNKKNVIIKKYLFRKVRPSQQDRIRIEFSLKKPVKFGYKFKLVEESLAFYDVSGGEMNVVITGGSNVDI